MSNRQLPLDFEETKLISPQVRLLSPDEIFSLANQDILGRIQESGIFERKGSGIHAAKLSEWICMWANTPPFGGIIALGIADDGEFEGCLKLDETTGNLR